MAKKLKTKKVISKRVKLSKTKNIVRACGQNHFNARDTGKATRNKRSNNSTHKTLNRNIAYALNK